jgi:CheY-like chemotaxis protein
MIEDVQSALDSRRTVLIVDDKRGNLIALEAVLSAEFNVVEASSGQEAISLLESREDVDVVLMDVHMPGMDGFETAGHIKKIPGRHDIPIIFITAVYREDPYIRMGYEAGGIDYFPKPFNPDILKLKVSIYASFRHRERHIREFMDLLGMGRVFSEMMQHWPIGMLLLDARGDVIKITGEIFNVLRAPGRSISDFGELLGWWDAAGKIVRDHVFRSCVPFKRGRLHMANA